MAIRKEREAFEKLPEIAKRIIAVKFNTTLNRYEAKSPVLSECNDAALYLNGAWDVYQALKAQAVPEVKLEYTVTLTCAQLLEAFRFGAPDEDDQEQLENEMTITWSDVGHSGKGYYCFYSELPEEGSIFLDEQVDAQESR